MLRKIIIILGWGLAGLTVVVGTFLLVAYGAGYSYDFKKHRLVRNGLLILESDPDGARVFINGKESKNKTPYRKTFEEGNYTFAVAKEGYRPWSKAVDMVASEVSLAQYVLLFEEQLKTETVATFPNINLFVPSRDHRHIAFNVATGSDVGLWSLATSNGSPRTKLYTPQAATAERPAEVIQEVSWSDDGSHLLVKTLLGDKVNWLVIADNGREPVINLTQNVGFDFPALRFNPQNWRELYWLSPEGLRRVNITDNNVTGVLAANVVDFGFSEDRVVYVDGSKPQRTLWALERSGRKVELDSKLPLADRYQIESARFRGTPKLAVLPVSTGIVLIFNDPFGANFGPDVAMKGVTSIQFNGDGHLLGGFNGQSITTYDLDKDKVWLFAPVSGLKFVSWLDSYHYLYDRDGQVVVGEFDGQNITNLLPASPLPSWNSADGKRIYTVTPSAAGHEIKWVRIRQ